MPTINHQMHIYRHRERHKERRKKKRFFNKKFLGVCRWKYKIGQSFFFGWFQYLQRSEPVSLEYIIGGAKFASAKFRCLGYFVLLNKCNTIQIRPASTAIPVVTPNNVGRSDVITDISVYVRREKCYKN